MRIACPCCGVFGTADDSYSGRKIRCPKCDEVFRCMEEDVEITLPDDIADPACVDETTEEVTAELFDLPDSVPEQAPDDDLIVEFCDYCSSEGKPGERLEIVDMKKACADCLPLLTGSGGKTANGFQPDADWALETQRTLTLHRKQGRKSLVENVVGLFKRLFSR